MQRTYTCCKYGLCGNSGNQQEVDRAVIQPLPITSLPVQVFLQRTEYELQAIYRFSCSLQTIQDRALLEQELELAECEQN